MCGQRTTPTTPSLRVTRHLARLAVRASRRRLRDLRRPRPARSLAVTGTTAGRQLRLVPVSRQAAADWLVLTRDERPPAEGLAASPLGGAARTRREWRSRARALRRHVRRGDRRGYLVSADGAVVGEALAFVDGGTELAELVVWLADVPAARGAYGPVIATLTADLLGAHARRAMFTAPVGDAAAAGVAARLGFDREGTLSDPPYPDRDVFVRHHDGSAGAAA